MTGPGLVLVGIPGSGKTTVADLLAQRWGLPLVDVDDLVEAHLGQPATEAFARGEHDYRAAEEQLSVAALGRPGVVALGSGAVDSPAVRAALAGVRVAWLRTSVAAATRRLGLSSLGMGTLLAIRSRMDAMLAERARWYSQVASVVVDTDRRTAAQVADALAAEQGEA